MANWDWLKNSSQWLNDNQGRFSATMSDLAGIVAPQNPFAASGLGRKLSERNVYAKALQEKQGDQDDARRLLQGILSGKVKPSPREQPGFTGLSLNSGRGGETFLKTEYTLSGAEDPDKAPTQGQSSLANRPVPPASSSDLPWDMAVGPSGTPDFSYRDPEMQGRIPPPEAVQQMLALREQGQQPRRPRVVNTQGQPVKTPQRSDFNPAELGILPTEKQAQLAQMGRYGDELGLALAKLMGDRDYQQQRLAMDWVQLNRPGKPAPPPEPELYYDAEGNPSWYLPGDPNIPKGTYPVGKRPKTPEVPAPPPEEPELYYDAEGNPSWHLPGDPNIPQGTYPVGKMPKTPEEPQRTLDLKQQADFGAEYNLLTDALRRGEGVRSSNGQLNYKGDLTQSSVDRANQLSTMINSGAFWKYEPRQVIPGWGNDIPARAVEYRLRSDLEQYDTVLTRIRQSAEVEGWQEAIDQAIELGLLVEVGE